MRHFEHGFVLWAGLAFTILGCGGPKSDMPFAPVEALVLLDGQPVEGATVTLVPVREGAASATGTTDPSGRAKLAVLVPGQNVEGEYYVGVVKSVVATRTEEEEPATSDQPSPEPQVEHIVPPRYNDPKRSGIRVTVAPGQKEVRIELTSNP